MDVTPLVKQGAQIIQAYANGNFRVSGQVYETPLFVSASVTCAWGTGARDVSQLAVSDFQAVVERSAEIDVVLLGTGDHIRHLPSSLKKELKESGLSVDVMDTGAACRTYNVLMAEGRRVVAALLPTSRA